MRRRRRAFVNWTDSPIACPPATQLETWLWRLHVDCLLDSFEPSCLFGFTSPAKNTALGHIQREHGIASARPHHMIHRYPRVRYQCRSEMGQH